MTRKRANKVGNVKFCYMRGQTFVALSERKLSSCSWCMNCRGTYFYEASLFKLEDEGYLRTLKPEMQYGFIVPFLLPYSQSELIVVGGGLVGPVTGIYLLSTETWEMK